MKIVDCRGLLIPRYLKGLRLGKEESLEGWKHDPMPRSVHQVETHIASAAAAAVAADEEVRVVRVEEA